MNPPLWTHRSCGSHSQLLSAPFAGYESGKPTELPRCGSITIQETTARSEQRRAEGFQQESQVSFAKRSLCDRQLFSSELVATWTARLCSRENGPVNVIRCQGSPFSAVRLVEQKLRKMAVFRSFLGKLRTGILRTSEWVAEQAVWR